MTFSYYEYRFGVKPLMVNIFVDNEILPHAIKLNILFHRAFINIMPLANECLRETRIKDGELYQLLI